MRMNRFTLQIMIPILDRFGDGREFYARDIPEIHHSVLLSLSDKGYLIKGGNTRIRTYAITEAMILRMKKILEAVE